VLNVSQLHWSEKVLVQLCARGLGPSEPFSLGEFTLMLLEPYSADSAALELLRAGAAPEAPKFHVAVESASAKLPLQIPSHTGRQA
jgi:hypothetical protein